MWKKKIKKIVERLKGFPSQEKADKIFSLMRFEMTVIEFENLVKAVCDE